MRAFWSGSVLAYRNVVGRARPKYHQMPEFLALRDEWYRKLHDDGFDDVEEHLDGIPEPYWVEGLYCPLLARGRSIRIPEEWDWDEWEYYRAADAWQWKREAKFYDDPRGRLERYVWEQHCNGERASEVWRLTKKEMGAVSWWKVYNILRTNKQRMIETIELEMTRDARRKNRQEEDDY